MSDEECDAEAKSGFQESVASPQEPAVNTAFIGFGEANSGHPVEPQVGGIDERLPFTPQTRLPIVPEQHSNSTGPNPDKKGAAWDIYGEPRVQPPPVSHAYVSINKDYLEIEGATDRRVRTASIAHKKNAAKAPNVSAVRKTGLHTLGLSTQISAKEILDDLGISGHDEHWKLSSTMQGLGDSNQLVEVSPGTCRFGPCRLGSMYRMTLFLRNLDVDVTRFNVAPVTSEFVSVKYTPGHIAPGMAAKIVVELTALAPAKIEQLVEVKVKAHHLRVPVTGIIFDAEEYDRLDAESLALHGRRIGRHQERNENNKPGPVELIRDEAYCRKRLGAAYMALPPDVEDATIGPNVTMR